MKVSDLLETKHCALLVIDLQNDYCSKDGMLPHRRSLDTNPIETMLDKLEKFIAQARERNIPILWTRFTEDDNHMPDNFKMKIDSLSDLAMNLCIKGTWGYEFYRLKPAKGDGTFDSNQYDALADGKLARYLKAHHIKTLILTGVYTSRAVDTTARSAATLGYNVFIPMDLVAMTRQQEDEHYASLTIINTIFGYVVDSNFVLDAWAGEDMSGRHNVFLKKLFGIR